MGLYVVSKPSTYPQDASTSAATTATSTASQLSTCSSDHSSQRKVSDYFSSIEKYKTGDLKQKEISYLIGEWLADAMLPFNTVNNKRFKILFENVHFKYKMPTDKYFRTVIIPHMFKRVNAKIEKVVLEEIEIFTATTDMWTSQMMQSYISLTVHFINSRWERKVLILACEPFFDDHTGINISDTLKKILSKWKIINKLHIFLRDSGSNILSAMRLAPFDSVPCFLHTLHLIVNAGVLKQDSVSAMMSHLQNCIKYFKNSAKGKEKLRKAQKALKVPTHSLILGEPTRWSSYYQSIQRAIEQKRAIRDATDQLELEANKTIRDEDWRLMDQVVILLEPFAAATVRGERETACVSEVLPTVLKLKRRLTKTSVTGVNAMKKELITQIDKYFYGIGGDANHRNRFQNIEGIEFYTISTALDPRFKLKVLGAEAAKATTETLVDKVYNILENDDAAVVSGSPPAKKSKTGGFFSDLDELLETSASVSNPTEGDSLIDNRKKALGVVNSYLAETLIDSESDPLSFWKMKEKELSPLAKLARKYLSPPIGTTTSEREFKMSSEITGGDRSKLLPENAEKLLFF